MRIVFTKNNMPLSQMIRWLFDEPVSHAAFLFDNDKWVFESNLFGTQITWGDYWRKKQEIVYSLEYEMTYMQEEKVFQTIMNENLGKSWDLLGALWLGLCGLRKKLFGIEMPSRNPFNKKQKLMCHELIEKLPREITGLSEQIESSAITPYVMFVILGSAK